LRGTWENALRSSFTRVSQLKDDPAPDLAELVGFLRVDQRRLRILAAGGNRFQRRFAELRARDRLEVRSGAALRPALPRARLLDVGHAQRLVDGVGQNRAEVTDAVGERRCR
jgi:hypothetical protein